MPKQKSAAKGGQRMHGAGAEALEAARNSGGNRAVRGRLQAAEG